MVLQDLNESNERIRSGELKEHILGIAFYRKDTETNPNADLGDTQFSFGDANARAEDLNNFHFGVTGKATGLFPEATLLQFAGMAEVLKYAE
ncbi:MAG: hypothetical protein DI535_05855 [Citrobacter freundii]|nr:MAG: hypothetical protein DI535_05855 [Citrobacter freundii]